VRGSKRQGIGNSRIHSPSLVTPAVHETSIPQCAGTDFALIKSELEVIQKQLARMPTRRELTNTALGIIFATMMLTTLSLLFFLR